MSPRASRILNIVSLAVLVLLLVALILYRIPSNSNLLLPSTALPVEPKIYVQNHPPPSGRGQFYMTFVGERQASLLERIFAGLDPDATLEDLPKGYSQSQEDQQMNQMMLDSTKKAELLALCTRGYKSLCSAGVQVASFAPYSKAKGLLQVGDIITKVDETPIYSTSGLRAVLDVERLHGKTVVHHPGDRFTVTVSRAAAKGRTQVVLKAVPTVVSPDSPPRAILGIGVQAAPPLSLPSKLPIDMKIDPGDIGGPSAGLMFTLGVLNRLSGTDLTHGRKIAGTGTIDLDGTVGAIGGVKQKVIGAEWAGAQYFLAPTDGGNCVDAKAAASSKITVQCVTSLGDALNFLGTLK